MKVQVVLDIEIEDLDDNQDLSEYLEYQLNYRCELNLNNKYYGKDYEVTDFEITNL